MAKIKLSNKMLVVLSVCLSFVIAESAARYLKGKQEDGVDKILDRQNEPYTMFGSYPEGLPSKEKEKGEYRIFVIGGSTVAIGGKYSIPSLLSEKFKNAFPHKNIKVYNLGVVSQKSSQEMVRLLIEQVDLNPDYIVVYNGGNDIMDPFYADPRPGYPMNYLIFEMYPFFYQSVSTYPAVSLFLFGSQLLRSLFPDFFLDKVYKMDEYRKENGYLTQPWRNKIAEIYVNNLVKMSKLARGFSFRFSAFFQPIVFFKASLNNDEQNGEDDFSKVHALETRKQILKLIAQYKNSKGSNVLDHVYDISTIYDKTPDKVFYDYIHTYDQFKAPVVDMIFNKVSQEIQR